MNQILSIAIRSYRLVKPYGRRRLVLLFCLLIAASFAQLLSVISVLPFLKLASDPDSINQLPLERLGLEDLRTWSSNQLLILAGCCTIGAMIIANAFLLSSEVARTRFAHKFGAFLRAKYLTCMAQQPYSFFLQANSGTLLTRLSEAMQFTSQVLMPLLALIARTITILLLVSLIIYVMPLGFLGIVLIGIIYGTIYITFRNFRQVLGKRIRDANRGATVRAQQLLGGIKTILVANKVDFFAQDYARQAKLQAKLAPYVPLLSSSPRYVVEPIVLGSLIVFLLITLSVDPRGFTAILPTISVLAFATYRLLPQIQQVFSDISMISTMSYTLDDIEELYDFLPSDFSKSLKQTNVKRMSFENTIELSELSFRYPEQTRNALDAVNLSIPKNHSLGIMGTTGSGKSTLVDTLLGLHTPNSGRLTVDGKAIEQATIQEWRNSIGYIPQSIYLIDDTLAANIAFGVSKEDTDYAKLKEVAEAAQILEFINSELPNGFDTVVGERGVRLSGGQIQRIGIARALYTDPDVLVFDEATSALDGQTEAAVVEAIREIGGAKTMLVIAHRLSTLRYCDQVVRLEQGRIVDQGTYEEVLATVQE